jgi:hypothetical protein
VLEDPRAEPCVVENPGQVRPAYAGVRRLREIPVAITPAGAAGDEPAVLHLNRRDLRGTNTRERLIASWSIIGKLAAGQAFGIVTSHDLSLTELEGSASGLVNGCFREEITANPPGGTASPGARW